MSVIFIRATANAHSKKNKMFNTIYIRFENDTVICYNRTRTNVNNYKIVEANIKKCLET